MAISRAKYISIRDSKYSPYSSWAVWATSSPRDKAKARMGDLSVFEESDSLLSTLHTDTVLVALNAADRDVDPVPFSFFHDPSPTAMDYKMRYALAGTILWGSYITDLFHGLRETESGKVKKYLANNPDFLARSLERFKEEMRFIASDYNKPILVALGSQVKDLLDEQLSDEYIVLALPHYSYSVMTKELYREKALELVENVSRQLS